MRKRNEPQQTTLSIRIPQSLREFRQRLRAALANGRKERVSLSDAAKRLLVGAQQSPLDEKLRVSSLLRDPTATLLEIRAKWERQAVISPAEWVVLARYIELVCEGTFPDGAFPKQESFLELLKAFQALLRLRVARPSSHDDYYLEKLPPSQPGKGGDHRIGTNVDALADDLISRLGEPESRVVPVYVGRALHVALRDEEYPSALALHEALSPFLPTLFRLGAHGHWLETHRPVRPPHKPFSLGSVPRDPGCVAVPACGGEFQITTLITSEGDLSMAVNLNRRDVVFTLDPYPQIREFMALLDQLPETGRWKGAEFFGYTDDRAQGASITRLYFRNRSTVLGFWPYEWAALRDAVRETLRTPVMLPIVAELDTQYGFA